MDAFLVSCLQDSGGRGTFSLASRLGVSRRLHDSDHRECGIEQCDDYPQNEVDPRAEIDPREFNRARPAGPAGSDGRDGKLPSPFRWKPSGETGSRETSSDQTSPGEIRHRAARNGLRVICVSAAVPGRRNKFQQMKISNRRQTKVGRQNGIAGRSNLQTYCVGFRSDSYFHRTARHTPRNTSASHLEITP